MLTAITATGLISTKANRKSTPRTLQFGCSKAEVQKKGFCQSISSISKPEMYDRYRGILDYRLYRVRDRNGSDAAVEISLTHPSTSYKLKLFPTLFTLIS